MTASAAAATAAPATRIRSLTDLTLPAVPAAGQRLGEPVSIR
jgi:hypothetical protein